MADDGEPTNVVVLPPAGKRGRRKATAASRIESVIGRAGETLETESTEQRAAPVNLDKFEEFCSTLKIDTKELGIITLNKEAWSGSQRYFVEEVKRGLADGIHFFVVLKGRQVMITTICLALDLFFLYKYGGLRGSIVTQDEETRDDIKATLTMYMDSLPMRFKVPIEAHNRTQLVAKNRSRVSYQVAGTRKNSKLGKGKGLTFLHGTEVSEWGDEEGLASLIASLAQINERRFFVFESTAQGFNMFTDMWDRAKDSTAQRAIFVGWWRNEFYSKPVSSKEFQVYWGENEAAGRFTAGERKWVDEVRELYDFEITPQQMAWWRWWKEEEIGDEDLMYQNYPPTERYAFIASGENFFSTARLSDEMKRIKRLPKGEMYRFVLRENFEDCDVVESIHKHCNLTIWEAPEPDGRYVIGADPAYGSSDWADRFCASVWRCYGDGVVQVAEFCTPDASPYQFAWVIMYLAGAYTKADTIGNKSSCMLNLEINGPGQAVFLEMKNIQRIAGATPKSPVSQKILLVARNLRPYLYSRVDNFGKPNAYHFKSTGETKELILNFFNDCFQRGIAEINSTALIEEMQRFKREDGQLSADGSGRTWKDDRVISAALALEAWTKYVRMGCIQAGLLRPKYDESGKQIDDLDARGQRKDAISSQMKGYLARLGVK